MPIEVTIKLFGVCAMTEYRSTPMHRKTCENTPFSLHCAICHTQYLPSKYAFLTINIISVPRYANNYPSISVSRTACSF